MRHAEPAGKFYCVPGIGRPDSLAGPVECWGVKVFAVVGRSDLCWAGPVNVASYPACGARAECCQSVAL